MWLATRLGPLGVVEFGLVGFVELMIDVVVLEVVSKVSGVDEVLSEGGQVDKELLEEMLVEEALFRAVTSIEVSDIPVVWFRVFRFGCSICPSVR